MVHISRTTRAEVLLSKRTESQVRKAVELHHGLLELRELGPARAALDTEITVVVTLTVREFLAHHERMTHGRYMEHLNTCGCRATGTPCEDAQGLADEWQKARERVGGES